MLSPCFFKERQGERRNTIALERFINLFITHYKNQISKDQSANKAYPIRMNPRSLEPFDQNSCQHNKFYIKISLNYSLSMAFFNADT